jgi:methionine-rich copper-binding protein CopC
MATAKAKPTDATGRTREKLQAEFAEQQQESASQMAMATAQKAVALETEIIDATKPNKAEIIIDEPTVLAEGEKTVTIRVVEDIEHMTFGAGNFFSFKAGQKYQVTRELARHLEEKGYLAGVI